MHRLRFQPGTDEVFEENLRVIFPETLEHLRVLRLRTGEKAEFVDFSGRLLYLASFSGQMSKKEAIFDKISVTDLPEDMIRIDLYQAKSKQAKHEFVAQRAVEAGVHAIRIFTSQFSDRSGDVKYERLNRISGEAALQSKAAVLTKAEYAGELREIDFSGYDSVFFFYEHASDLPVMPVRRSGKKENANCLRIAVIVGSEGGFSEEEAQWARDTFGAVYSLGERILRTETAAVLAVGIVLHEYRSHLQTDGKTVLSQKKCDER